MAPPTDPLVEQPANDDAKATWSEGEPPDDLHAALKGFNERGRESPHQGEAVLTSGGYPPAPCFDNDRTAMLVEALEIAERALATVVEGDPMGVPKNTQCRHGRYTFEGCESCTDAVLDPALEAVRAALASVEPTAAKGD